MSTEKVNTVHVPVYPVGRGD